MSGTTIIFAIFGVACFFIGLIFISQMRERARIEKVRKVNALITRHKRMQVLSNDIPPQYLNNELRILIAERSIESLTGLITLKNENKFKLQLSEEQTLLTQLREQKQKFTPVTIQNEAKAKDVCLLLESLSRLIQNLNKQKRLDAESAKKHRNHIDFSICHSKAVLFIAQAEEASKAGKHRVAIHNFHNAIDAFKILTNNPQATKTVAQFNAEIKSLEQSSEQVKGGQENSSKPIDNKEWDDFMKDEENDWQKKNDYE